MWSAFLFFVIVFVFPVLAGLFIGRLINVNFEWHESFRCKKCGHSNPNNGNYIRRRECKGCGEHSERVREIRRANWIGYEYKKGGEG